MAKDIHQTFYETANSPIIAYLYDDKMYYYENYEIKIKMIEHAIKQKAECPLVVEYPPVLGHISAFTVALFDSQACILSINAHHVSSDHYFDKIYNKLIIVNCDTMAQIHTLNLPEINDIYITAITYESPILTLYHANGKKIIHQINATHH
jgi:hypothetical protein